jgi:hypothetical protein
MANANAKAKAKRLAEVKTYQCVICEDNFKKIGKGKNKVKTCSKFCR